MIKFNETVTHEISSIIDTNGIEWRVDHLLTGEAARVAQVYPRHSVIYLSPPDSPTERHSAITVPDDKLRDILLGQILMKVSEL